MEWLPCAEGSQEAAACQITQGLGDHRKKHASSSSVVQASQLPALHFCVFLMFRSLDKSEKQMYNKNMFKMCNGIMFSIS